MLNTTEKHAKKYLKTAEKYAFFSILIKNTLNKFKKSLFQVTKFVDISK